MHNLAQRTWELSSAGRLSADQLFELGTGDLFEIYVKGSEGKQIVAITTDEFAAQELVDGANTAGAEEKEVRNAAFRRGQRVERHRREGREEKRFDDMAQHVRYWRARAKAAEGERDASRDRLLTFIEQAERAEAIVTLVKERIASWREFSKDESADSYYRAQLAALADRLESDILKSVGNEVRATSCD